mgnify:FL=1
MGRRISRMFSSGRDDNKPWFNREINEKMEKWLGEKGYVASDQKMSQVAESFGVSKDELSWYCRNTFGKSFLTLRKELRIREARRLIAENPAVPLSNIGEKVGINDKTNFRRQFYEVMGMTPQEFRDKINTIKAY